MSCQDLAARSEVAGALLPAAAAADTPMLLDHRYFPHIFDLIIAFAPGESLVVLSRVSSWCRKRAFAQLRHLRGLALCWDHDGPGDASDTASDTPAAGSEYGDVQRFVHVQFRDEATGSTVHMRAYERDSLAGVCAADVLCCGLRTRFDGVHLPNLRGRCASAPAHTTAFTSPTQCAASC